MTKAAEAKDEMWQEVIERCQAASPDEKLHYRNSPGELITEIVDELLDLRADREAETEPTVEYFLGAVEEKARRQRQRWGGQRDADDDGKPAADWVWLIGHSVGKVHAAVDVGDIDLAKANCIAAAALLARWHAALKAKKVPQ